MKRLILTLSASLGLLVSNASLNAASMLHYTSSKTSWVGQGQTVTLTPGLAAFTAVRYFDEGVHTNAVELRAHVGYDWYILTVVGPNYTLPTVGSYSDATRWPFMESGAGLDFSALGHGNNTLTGHFDVLQADYDRNGNVLAFEVNFVQYDEGVTADWVSGTFRYDSGIPEPASMAVLGIGSLVLLRRRRR